MSLTILERYECHISKLCKQKFKQVIQAKGQKNILNCTCTNLKQNLTKFKRLKYECRSGCKKSTMGLLNTLWLFFNTRSRILVNNLNHSFISVSPENPKSKVDQALQRKI